MKEQKKRHETAANLERTAVPAVNVEESLKKKKELSYYYAHARGNKASDVDISMIGEKGGYGIGEPQLLATTPTKTARPSRAKANSEFAALASKAAAITNYSWEDGGKFVKIYVDAPPTATDEGQQDAWSPLLESTASSFLLVLQQHDGKVHKLDVPRLFAQVTAVTATKSKSGKRCIVKLKKQEVRVDSFLLRLLGYPRADRSLVFTLYLGDHHVDRVAQHAKTEIRLTNAGQLAAPADRIVEGQRCYNAPESLRQCKWQWMPHLFSPSMYLLFLLLIIQRRETQRRLIGVKQNLQ